MAAHANSPRAADAVNAIASRLLALKPRYEQVATRIGMSWAIIALLHQREADCNFACVLHNGEKIVGTGRRTTLVRVVVALFPPGKRVPSMRSQCLPIRCSV